MPLFNIYKSIKENYSLLIILLLIFIILPKLFLHFSLERIGHDYSYVIPLLFEYKYFRFNNNLLSVFLYSPTLCGVVPAFANPNNFYYAFYNIFWYINDFVYFQILVYLFSSSITCIYSYKLCRLFSFSHYQALLASIIFSFSEFFYIKILVGHLKYSYFCFFPIISYYFLISKNIIDWHLVFSIIFSVLIVYGGSGDLLPFLFYSILLCCYILKNQNNELSAFKYLKKFVVYLFFVIGISLFKIVPSVLFLINFERSEYLSKYIFENLSTFILSFFINSFISPLQSLDTSLSLNSSIGTWEISLGLGFSGLLLFFLGLLKIRFFEKNSLFSFLIIIFAPFFLLVDNPLYGLIKNNFPFNFYTHYQRYLYSYFPIFIFILSSGFKLIFEIKSKKIILFSLSFILLLFVFDKFYLPKWQYKSEIFWDNRVAKEIILKSELSYQKNFFFIDKVLIEKNYNYKNTGIFNNTNNLNCYEPIFGYSSEKLPANNIKIGNIEVINLNQINMFNPDCFLKYNSYSCKPGELFNLDNLDKVKKIQSFKSIDLVGFNIYFYSLLLSLISLFVLLFLIFYKKLEFIFKKT